MFAGVLIVSLLRQERKTDAFGIAPPEQIDDYEIKQSQSFAQGKEEAKRCQKIVQPENIFQYQAQYREHYGKENQVAKQDGYDRFLLRCIFAQYSVFLNCLLNCIGIGTQTRKVLLSVPVQRKQQSQ